MSTVKSSKHEGGISWDAAGASRSGKAQHRSVCSVGGAIGLGAAGLTGRSETNGRGRHRAGGCAEVRGPTVGMGWWLDCMVLRGPAQPQRFYGYRNRHAVF